MTALLIITAVVAYLAAAVGVGKFLKHISSRYQKPEKD